MNAHRFVEPRSWDTPLADMPDWDEIERVAAELRRFPMPENERTR